MSNYLIKNLLAMKKNYYQKVVFFLIFILLTLIIGKIDMFGQVCNCDDEDLLTSALVSSDGFESYSANNYLPMGGSWSLYPSSSGYYPISGTIVTNPVYCGNKSLKVQYSNNQYVDIRYELDGFRTTIYMFVPTGKSAKIAFLDGNNNTITEIIFGIYGQAEVESGTEQTTFSYPQNTWFRFSSLTKSEQTSYLFLNDDNVASLNVSHSYGYLNLYSHNSQDLFYIDKICHLAYNWIQVICPQIFEPVCLNNSDIEIAPNSCEATAGGFLSGEFHLCTSGGNACDNATPIDCGETISSTTIGETFKFYRPDYGNCLPNYNGANDFRAPDKIFRFVKTDNTGDVGIHLFSKTYGVDFDIFLIDYCGNSWCGTQTSYAITVPPDTPPNSGINCIASGISYVDPNGYDTEFINITNLPAGEYYIIVDGQHYQENGHNDDVGNFDLSLTCKDLVCTNFTNIYCNIPLNNQSLSSGTNNVSVYCSPLTQGSGNPDPIPSGTGCTGKERVYHFTAQSSGIATIQLTGIDQNEDFELFLLENCDHTYCLGKSTNSYGYNESISFNTVMGHDYQIVVDGYNESSGNYNLLINCCADPIYFNCSNNGTISFHYSGNGNNLLYNFTTTETIPEGYQWVVKRNGEVINYNAGTGNSVSILFPNSGSYEICIPFLNSQGCIGYCCFPVYAENPFACNSIVYSYNSSNNSYNFNVQNAGTNGQWFADNGSNTPTPIGGLLPVGNCVIRTISYRYFDGSYWRYCCRKIWVCNPFTCGDILATYKPSINQYTFTLNGSSSNWNNFAWTLDETNTNIGNAQTIVYIPPSNLPCKSYTYSLRYWDGSSWRLCCIPIYICDPNNCQGNIVHTYSNNKLNLSTNNPNANDIKWYLNDTPVNASSTQPNGSYVICMYFYDNVNKYYRSCKKTVSLGGGSSTQEEDQNAIILYPNPTDKHINFESEKIIRNLEVLNYTGEVIMNLNKINSLKGDIDLSKLSSGIYILRLSTDDGDIFKKISLIK